MWFRTTRHKRNFILLLACIGFFAAGIVVLAFGAVKHVDPEATFASLFKWQSYVPLVYSFAP